MTGEEDFRRPIPEAEQYYAALKLLKVESVLVRFPANPMASAAAQATKVVYTLNWFDEHRKKPW
jgi:dipeptidyl aminopeptidase/acylaminoacyl peptidase